MPLVAMAQRRNDGTCVSDAMRSRGLLCTVSFFLVIPECIAYCGRMMHVAGHVILAACQYLQATSTACDGITRKQQRPCSACCNRLQCTAPVAAPLLEKAPPTRSMSAKHLQDTAPGSPGQTGPVPRHRCRCCGIGPPPLQPASVYLVSTRLCEQCQTLTKDMREKKTTTVCDTAVPAAGGWFHVVQARACSCPGCMQHPRRKTPIESAS